MNKKQKIKGEKEQVRKKLEEGRQGGSFSLASVTFC